MKYLKILFALALVVMVCSAATLKKSEPKVVYAFGFASSFTDSVAYHTDIQLLDSVALSKEGFLPHRDIYSTQLRNYLTDNHIQPRTTAMIYFSGNKKKLEKELSNLLKKYSRGSSSSVVRIEPDKFRFKKIEEQ